MGMAERKQKNVTITPEARKALGPKPLGWPAQHVISNLILWYAALPDWVQPLVITAGSSKAKAHILRLAADAMEGKLSPEFKQITTEVVVEDKGRPQSAASPPPIKQPGTPETNRNGA
jgi:hypothetical protein